MKIGKERGEHVLKDCAELNMLQKLELFRIINSQIMVLDYVFTFNLKMPGAGFERATARSSAECSPGLSYPGISHFLYNGD